jgi:hypothetical protein
MRRGTTGRGDHREMTIRHPMRREVDAGAFTTKRMVDKE